MYQTKLIFTNVVLTTLLLLFAVGLTHAQPTPAELADRIHESQQNQLRGIQNITIIQEMPFVGDVESYYEKVEEDGRFILRSMEGDDDEFFLLSSMDQDFRRVIMGASSITNDSFDGIQLYKVFIDDKELLESLDTDNFDLDPDEDMMGEIKSATFWVDRSNYNVHRTEVVQVANGNEMTINIHLKDYRQHSGLYIPHIMEMSIDGMENMFSDEEVAEARAAMRELEAQLEQMPEAQRDMIMQQFSSQIEQLEAVLAGESTSMEIKVIDVIINQ